MCHLKSSGPRAASIAASLRCMGLRRATRFALHPQPSYGYGGAVAVAQRLVDAFYGLRP